MQGMQSPERLEVAKPAKVSVRLPKFHILAEGALRCLSPHI